MIDLHEGIRALKDGLDSILDGFRHITLFPATDYGEIHREYQKRREEAWRRRQKEWEEMETLLGHDYANIDLEAIADDYRSIGKDIGTAMDAVKGEIGNDGRDGNERNIGDHGERNPQEDCEQAHPRADAETQAPQAL